MTVLLSTFVLAKWLRPLWRGLQSWWALLMAAAILLVLALHPSVWRQQAQGRLSSDVVAAAWPLLATFTVAFGLLAWMLLSMIAATTAQLGLGALATEMALRLLVMTLLPWAVALAVLVNITLPQSADLRREIRQAIWASQPVLEDAQFYQALPRVLASLMAFGLLFMSSTVLVVVMHYGVTYGLSWFAFDAFTRQVGQVFTPVFTLVLSLKSLLFALVVTLLPMATLAHKASQVLHNADMQLRTLVRVLVALFGLELLSLLALYG